MNLPLHPLSRLPGVEAVDTAYPHRVMKAYSPMDEQQRLAALRALQLPGSPPDVELDRITRLAARLFDVPIAVVSLVDAEREWFHARVGLDIDSIERSLSFCTHTLRGAQAMVVEDARQDPRFRDNPLVSGAPRIIFYLGQTLYSHAGHALGALCLIDHVPRHLAPEELKLFTDLVALAQERLQRIELARHARALGQDSLRLEYALRESERRYMALFNNRTNGIMHMRMVCDAGGQVVNYTIEAVNEAYERIIGRARKDLEGRLVTDAFPGIDRLPGFKFLEPYAAVAMQGQEVSFERFFPPLGRWFNVYGYSPAPGECICIFNEVTEKKAYEAALQEREQMLRATFEQSAIGIVHVSPSGAFVRANPRFCDMLGYTEEELRDRHFNDITPDEDKGRSLEEFRRAGECDPPTVTLEKRYFRKDGSTIWGRVSITAVRDAVSGVPLYNLAMIEDITVRKEAEAENERLLQELRATVIKANHSRAQLEAVFESIDEGIAVLDMQGNLVLLNRALARINRFGNVEDMQRHLHFFDRIYELRDADDRRVPLEQWPASRALRGEYFSDWQVQVARHDVGFSGYFSYSGAPVYDEDGQQVLAVVVNRDISASKALQQELQQAQRELEQRVLERTAALEVANAALVREKEHTRVVLETATDAYVAADDKGRITDWNRAAERMFGWQADEVMGRTVTEILIPLRYRSGHDPGFGRTGECGAVSGRGREFTARHRDGHEFPVEISLSTNRFDDSWTISAFLRDISERKRGEAALRRAHDELAQSLAAEQAAARAAEAARLRAEASLQLAESANRAKSEFLATMSHEIRTPLNGVIGFNGLLLDGPLGEDKRHYAELARRSGESLLHLLNDFLDFSKIESGHLELEPTAFDPHLEASHALSLVRESAQKKSLLLDCRVQAPACVRGDAARLRQILLNLLSNAVKFTECGGITLRCEELAHADGKTWLLFEVSDTGIGIDASVRDRLFQPFVQADASTTRRFGGTGLGLAICKRLAEAMGGKIGVRSELGRGSTFWVELPFVPVEAADMPEPLTESPQVTLPDQPRGRVLVVEDNPVSQLMAVEMLKRLGCRVDVAGNGLEAVEALRRLPYDLIFMDCDMPLMNGFDATRAIRLEERGKGRVPIVAITASALKGDSERCLAVGMDDFMSKPFRLQDMARMVDAWLASPEAGRSLPAVRQARRQT